MPDVLTRRLVLLLAPLVLFGAPLAAQDNLSLAQRRAVEAYKADILPGYIAKITAAVGKDVPLDVDWPAIAGPDQADLYLDPQYWTDIYFEPLVAALAAVARDEMGKTALAGALTGIRITHDPATAPMSAYADGLTFEGGVLTLNFTPYANAADVAPRAQAIQKLLENSL